MLAQSRGICCAPVCTALALEQAMRSVTERGMLVEPRSNMLTAARGAASRVRRCTAAWGCARLATERCSQAQPSRATPYFRSLGQQRASCNHARNLSTFAAASTRHTLNLLDPGDYEAGQIQVGAFAVQALLPQHGTRRVHQTSALVNAPICFRC